MLTKEEYLQALTGLEEQLKGYSDAAGKLFPDPSVQDLRKAWEAIALALCKDYPEAKLPVPFWASQRQDPCQGVGRGNDLGQETADQP